MATGDCATALTLRPEAPGAATRIAMGGCALTLGQPERALAFLSSDAPDPLQSYESWYRARALAELGRRNEALEALRDVVLPGMSGRRVQLLRGRLHADLANPEATEELKDLADTPLWSEARFWLAEGLGVRGDTEAMVTALSALWTDASPGGWDQRAADRLQGLGRAVPRLDDDGGRQQALARVESLRRANRHPEALALLLAVRQQVPANNDTERIALAQAHARARDYAGALTHWRDVLGAPEAASGKAQHLFDYALTTARTGDYDLAAVIYRRLIDEHPSSNQADFASYKLGYMAYDQRDCSRATPLLAAHVAAHEESKHLDEALWFLARCRWRDGDVDGAVAALDQLGTDRRNSSLVPGAAYWTARAKGLQGDPDGERKGLQAVIKSWPTSGYAWFSAAHLGRTFAAVPAASPPEWTGALAANEAVIRAEALLSAGLRDLARIELQGVDAGGKKAAVLALAWARIRAGDYRGGQKLAGEYCSPPWKGGDPVAQQACFPRPEASIVETAAGRYALEPLLPFGIMTAESALDPAVSSQAGARGLMQLMPELAEELNAELYPERLFNADDLFSAPYNVALGTTELGQKKQALGEVLEITSLPAVIASYNGGEEAVRRWLRDYEQPPPFDTFAEDIGYTETRRYVKRVLGFVMAYRWVYGDPAPESPHIEVER